MNRVRQNPGHTAISGSSSQHLILPRLSATTISGRGSGVPGGGVNIPRCSSGTSRVGAARIVELPNRTASGLYLRGKRIIEIEIGREVRDTAIETDGRVDDDFWRHGHTW